MTLAQGLAEYFEANPGLTRGDSLPSAAKQFFSCHDVVHVVYGCGTSLPDELVVKIASVVGTTGGFGMLRGYALHASFEIYRQLPLLAILQTLLVAIWLVPRTVWCCLHQRRRWPWDGSSGWLQTPLCDLRRAFGIRVAHMGRAPAG